MTAEEAIRILDPRTSSEALEKIESYCGFSGKMAKFIAAYDASTMAIDALREQKRRRWIPAAVILPELNKGVLVIVSGKPHENITLDNAVEIATYSDDCGWILNSWPEWESANVTYWMPIPEPPKEDNDAKMQ